MDEIEEMDYINTTANHTEWTPWHPAETLKLSQILTLTWSLVTLIPNAILIYILIKNALYKQKNFYFTMLHWTVANTMLILFTLYGAAVPEAYMSIAPLEILYFVDMFIRFVPVVFATLFIFDKFVKSKCFCRYTIYCVWGIICVSMASSIICVILRYVHILFFTPIFLCLTLLCVLIVIIKSIINCIRPSDEETSVLRLIISGNYVIISFIYWALSDIFGFTPWVVPVVHILTILFYGNSLINLILLICCDPTVKMYFYQLCQKKSEYINVQFSKNQSDEVSTANKTEPAIVP